MICNLYSPYIFGKNLNFLNYNYIIEKKKEVLIFVINLVKKLGVTFEKIFLNQYLLVVSWVVIILSVNIVLKADYPLVLGIYRLDDNLINP